MTLDVPTQIFLSTVWGALQAAALEAMTGGSVAQVYLFEAVDSQASPGEGGAMVVMGVAGLV